MQATDERTVQQGNGQEQKPERSKRQAFHKELQEETIKAIRNNDAPWQKDISETFHNRPFNPSSGKQYEGANMVNLALRKEQDQRWLTMWQVNQLNNGKGRITPGSVPAAMVFYTMQRSEPRIDGYGNPVIGRDGKQVVDKVRLSKPTLEQRYLFPAKAVRDAGKVLGPFEPRPAPDHAEGMKRIRTMIAASGLEVVHRDKVTPHYDQFGDKIVMNPPESYPSRDDYDKQLMYHVIESTRHQDRLNRYTGPNGTENRTREDLRVKVAAWMVSQEVGVQIGTPGSDHALTKDYVALLEKGEYEMMRISRDAAQAKDMVMGLEQKLELQQESQVEREDRLEREGPELVDAAMPTESLPGMEVMEPEAELAVALEKVGLGLEGRDVVLDGGTHVVGNGSYTARLDGATAEAIVERATGEKVEVATTGVILTDNSVGTQKEKAHAKRQERQQAMEKGMDKEQGKDRDMTMPPPDAGKTRSAGRSRGMSR